MIAGITILLLCQLAGEIIAQLLRLPVPGPVIGMALLFIGLVIRGGIAPGLEAVSRGLLGNLSLLFVPAGVGIMLYFKLLAQQWLPIAGVLVGGTLLTIAVTGLLMQRLNSRENSR